ncbi:MAG: 50S ribosomal protein L22 [Carboxylicivirga sp.]|jgi:large subunit ribosomal protein L22|uniref:50S ribosomal protein L22 n=1 Tax=Carboxylicivirga agarovorans TaxID=3417570 RepID=UPI003D331118|nr:50S ribosomal protein L22 [Carboxylicivirga sp.]MCT4646197.1 50S ribosomal protein L22 [Carboxylicivirga sp.]
MGARKRIRAEKIKEAKKSDFFAKLNNVPTSPRKMRLVADMIRGKEVNLALDMLKFSSKEASRRVEKLLLSAIANWKEKNEGVRIEDANLYVSEIAVDSGRILKRLRPAPQGRAHRIRKRSNHVTLRVASKVVSSETQEN